MESFLLANHANTDSKTTVVKEEAKSLTKHLTYTHTLHSLMTTFEKNKKKQTKLIE